MLTPRTDHLIDLALEEDAGLGDVTSRAIFPARHRSRAVIDAKQDLVVCGLEIAARVFARVDPALKTKLLARDGDRVKKGANVLRIEGPTASLLTAERTALNFLQRLSGIATQARRYADAVKGTGVRIVDTRKTTPGFRALEKYAVRTGGCFNHRSSLGEHVLIKDNHLACRASKDGKLLDPGTAVQIAKKFVSSGAYRFEHPPMIEIEIDRIDQLESALSALPDIVLLDNMNCDQLKECVLIRDRSALSVELEASGGVNLETIGNIALTGIDRISVGALTHSAINLDLGLDWILNNG